MANYVLYHQNNYAGTKELIEDDKHIYCTDIMMLSIRDALIEAGHTAKIEYFPVIQSDGNHHVVDFKIPEFDIEIERAPVGLWFIIGNMDTGKFVIIDLQDSPGITYRLSTHKNFSLSFVGQFSLERYAVESNGNLDLTKLIPFVYCAYYPRVTQSLTKEIQEFRKTIDKLDDRIFFYGNNRDSYVHSEHNDPNKYKIREVISVLEQKYPDESCVGSWEAKLPLEEFFKKAAMHTISLALPGHQWCSREHELWTLGLPVMMYEHTHHMAVDLIPNHHYIGVAAGPRYSIGMARDPELAADRIIKTHREWIKPENRSRLDYIANNGRERIEKYASPEIIGKTLLPLLAIGHW